jgi:hypothetical protein
MQGANPQGLRRRKVADWLLVIGLGWFGLSLLAPSWPPYETIVAALVAGLALLFGDYRRRWWPIAPVTDRDREIHLGETRR